MHTKLNPTDCFKSLIQLSFTTKIILLFITGTSWHIILGIQGIDGTDVGFCNTFYQLFFTKPDANTFNYIYYLTGLLGGLWNNLMGEYGLLGFRIFEAVTLTTAIGILTITFRSILTDNQCLLAVGLSFLFPCFNITFHYNTLSFLLIAVSLFCFKKALYKEYDIWLVACGFMLGLSFMARIVNVTLFSLIFIPILFYSRQHLYYKSVWMAVGIICGLLCVATIMFSLNHHNIYIHAIQEAFFTFSGKEATHSHTELFSRYMHSFVNITVQMLALVAIGYIYYITSHKSRHIKYSFAILSSAILAVLAYTSLPYLTMLSLCILIIIGSVKKTSLAEKETFVCLYCLSVTLIYPFGSDIGIQGIFHWCAGILIFPAISRMNTNRTEITRKATYYALLLIGIMAILRTSLNVYGEDVSRAYCTKYINNRRLNVFTSTEKARNYTRHIAAIEQHLGKSRLLFITNQISELYYATNSLPYEGHTQPIIYQGEQLTWRLDERLHHFMEFPLIAMFYTSHISKETAEIQRITRLWMQKHKYRKVYDDGDMRLYKAIQDYETH